MSPETESLHNTIQESMEECSSFIIEICDRECMLSLLTLSEKLTWSRHQHIYIKTIEEQANSFKYCIFKYDYDY